MLVENSHTPDALTEAFATVDGLMATGKYARSLSVMLPFVQSGELDAGLLDRTADCFLRCVITTTLSTSCATSPKTRLMIHPPGVNSD